MTNISLLFRREIDKASEKKRNICHFKQSMCVFFTIYFKSHISSWHLFEYIYMYIYICKNIYTYISA